MYKRNSHDLWKHLDFILLDILMLLLAYFLAFHIRFHFSMDARQDALYVGKLILTIVSDFAAIAIANSYRGILKRGYLLELWAVLRHVTLVVVIVLVFSFASHNSMSISRLFMGYFYLLSIALVYVERLVWKSYVRGRIQRRDGRRVILVGARADLDRILDVFDAQGFLELKLCGVILCDVQFAEDAEKTYRGLPVVAIFGEEAIRYIEATPLDGVIFSRFDTEEMKDLVTKCQIMGLTVHIASREGDSLIGEVNAELLGGVPVISSCIKLVSSDELLWKRLIDLMGATVGLLVTGIALLFVAPLVYLSDPGPIFFRQKRIGEGGKVFDCFKIRSMYTDAEERKKELMDKNQMTGFMFKMENDPRIIGSGADGTRKGIGWFMRTFSIDELPQFWNVMKGDMSLVGTRPPTLDEWEHYDPHHRVRMRVRPGITGLWQVSGRSEITDFEEVVKLDQKYITNWSIGLDIKILLKTIVVVIRRKGSK